MQLRVGPQRDSAVAGATGEAQALVHHAGADAQPSGPWLDQQQPQLGGVRRVVLGGHAEHRTGPLAVHLGDPAGLLGGVVPLRVVGHHPGHQCLELDIPAVLGGVQGTVAGDHPAQVTGLRRAQQDRPGGRYLAEHASDGGHRPGEFALSFVGQRGEQLPDRADLVAFQLTVASLPGLGQANDLAAAVVRGRRPEHPPGDLEPRQDPAQVARVQIEQPADHGDLDRAAVSAQLVEHPCLDQGVRGAGQPVPQDADHPGVEAVEGPDLRDPVHMVDDSNEFVDEGNRIVQQSRGGSVERRPYRPQRAVVAPCRGAVLSGATLGLRSSAWGRSMPGEVLAGGAELSAPSRSADMVILTLHVAEESSETPIREKVVEGASGPAAVDSPRDRSHDRGGVAQLGNVVRPWEWRGSGYDPDC